LVILKAKKKTIKSHAKVKNLILIALDIKEIIMIWIGRLHSIDPPIKSLGALSSLAW
jgi:hypothetical protein